MCSSTSDPHVNHGVWVTVALVWVHRLLLWPTGGGGDNGEAVCVQGRGEKEISGPSQIFYEAKLALKNKIYQKTKKKRNLGGTKTPIG